MYYQKIQKTNENKLECAKILFQFILMIVSAVIIGAMLSSKCSDIFCFKAQNAVFSHFENLFSGVYQIKDIVSAILRYSSFDIVATVIIFLVSFAVCNYTATDILLVICGIRYGFSVTFLSEYLHNDIFSYNINVLQFVVFALFKLAGLLLIAHYAYYAAINSAKMRYKTPTGRLSIHLSNLVTFFAITFAYIGALVLINGAYCGLLYLLK